MRLIVITRPDFFPGEAEAVTALFRNGLETLHLRKPGASEPAVETFLRTLPEEYRRRIVIHDHFDLALRYGLGGIHLNSRNPLTPAGYGGSISCSCHSVEEAARCKSACDYLFLSPVYDSISKSGYAAVYSPDILRQAHEQGIIDQKVIALGGIDHARLCEVHALGFGGAALLGDIWMQPEADFLPHFREMLTEAGRCMSPAVILAIAGSDSSAGAGIQADLKSAAALGAYAATVITAVTAQNTLGVQAVQAVNPEMVSRQIAAVMDDLHPSAIKIGMIPNAAVVLAIADTLREYRPPIVVLDPVMVSTSGRRLMEEDTLQVVERELLPCCTLLTPNLHEAAMLIGKPINDIAGMEEAASTLASRHHLSVLVKGGHLKADELCDVLCHHGRILRFTSRKIATPNLHGTGCTLSSAIATLLGQGNEMKHAVSLAKHYMDRAIEAGRYLHVGHGNGPLQHFVP